MTRNPIQRLFDWKIRGVRWIEIIGVVCVGAMIFSVYVAKAAAARESVRIGRLERDIAETRQRVRLLRAEAARLEQPGRLESLSRTAGLGPVDMDREAEPTALGALMAVPDPVAVVPAATLPSTVTPVIAAPVTAVAPLAEAPQ